MASQKPTSYSSSSANNNISAADGCKNEYKNEKDNGEKQPIHRSTQYRTYSFHELDRIESESETTESDDDNNNHDDNHSRKVENLTSSPKKLAFIVKESLRERQQRVNKLRRRKSDYEQFDPEPNVTASKQAKRSNFRFVLYDY